jgi:NAD(P)-dependent dehydrogenase (short-subunit alcohol dehydrogenase family)
MLAPKSSIVTGGSGAIGKAIACLLASHGSSVAICGRRLPPLEAACADISRALPPSCTGSVRPYVCDVTQEADAVALFSACSDVDLLVNSAGIAAGGPTSELSKSTFQNVLDVNVLGPFLCSREAMKHMASRGTGGRIINVGSISAYSPRPNSAPYTTSKFALDGLTRSLALDGREMGIAVIQTETINRRIYYRSACSKYVTISTNLFT